MARHEHWIAAAVAAACCLAANAADAPARPPHGPQGPHGSQVMMQQAVFARVGDAIVTLEQFETAMQQAARSKFYHGKPPEGGMAALQREVSQQLIDEILLEKEARRRQVKPDAAAVREELNKYEKRYGTTDHWKANRAVILPGLKAKLERDTILEQLQKQVKTVAEPTPQQLEKYYQEHKDKFTSPETLHISMIMLKVDPSSPKAKWDEAKAEGAAVAKKLRAGADFKALAKQHSKDPSAERGGDLGYIHRGMMPEAAQDTVDKMKAGDTSEAVVLLEGVAVFRLHARNAPKLNPLEAVRQRAQDLWMRDRGDEAWTALVAKLRRETPAKIDETKLLPLPVAAKASDQPAR
jgi:parvulin-like peptidyl-prolyl isomerase